MYTDEQRAKAVERFFSGSLSMREVVDELGYPTRSSLGRWVREDPRYDPRATRRAPYDQDVRVRAAEMMRSGMSAAEVAEKLGVGSVASVYNWARDYGRKGADALGPQEAPSRSACAELAELRDRCRTLERENEALRAVLDALSSGGSGPLPSATGERSVGDLPDLNTPEAEFGA